MPQIQPPSADMNALIALYNGRRYAELESQILPLIKQYPDFGVGWKLLGGALQMQGKNALPAFQKVTELMPDDAEAHYNLGVVLNSSGRLEAAVASYRRALKIKPGSAETHNNLGNTLKDLGRLDDAVASYRRSLKIKPDSADAHNNLGTALKDLGRFNDAIASYHRAVALKPDFVLGYYNLGNAHKELGQLDDAVKSYRRAVEIKPDFVDAHINLGGTLKELGQLDAAATSFRRAISLKPAFANAHSNLGVVLHELGHQDGASDCYRRALEIDPECIEAVYGVGELCMENGDMAAAEEQSRRVLEIEPDNLEARFLLAHVNKVKAGDENLAALKAAEVAARNALSPMPDKKAIPLHFALGKSFDDIGDYDKAFPHFIEGCKLKRATLKYDAENTTQFTDEIMRVFGKETLERLQGGGDPSRLPIFVLGMPRSGTTLTEQIISSHPEVYGAGELSDLNKIANRDITGTGALFPKNVPALDHAELAKWGAEYVAGLHRLAPDAMHITNKAPANFVAIGLIHVMLPNAKIIHVNRNPVDTCLSCFTNLFIHKNLGFTYDLAELGSYYANYARLMAYWRSVLPAGAFLDVQYEDIVANQETQARRIIDFCGLDWNDACITFHKNKRSIRTASVTQVRQPIYKSSVERWRNYEEFLGPLLDALGDFAPKQN